MSQEDESERLDRRRMLRKTIPFAANLLWETRSALSPAKLASSTVNGYTKIENDLKMQRAELSDMLGDIPEPGLSYGREGLLLAMSRSQFLTLSRNYLRMVLLGKNNRAINFSLSHPEYDAVAYLTDRTIFVKLQKSELDISQTEIEIEKARKLNPSEVWIFSHKDIAPNDFRFDPIFISENKVLRGHLRIMPASAVVTTVCGGKYAASSLDTSSTDEFRFLLTRT
jgi:hypothetical protein